MAFLIGDHIRCKTKGNLFYGKEGYIKTFNRNDKSHPYTVEWDVEDPRMGDGGVWSARYFELIDDVVVEEDWS